jgi:flagellar hook-associated protein 2
MASTASIGSTGSLESLVQQYMTLERRPLTTMQTNRNSLSTKSSLLDDVKTQLQDLQDLAEEMAETDADKSVFNTVQASSSDTDTITVSSNEGAAEGTYLFRVRQLATSTTMKSTAYLNTAASVKSSSQVVAGTGYLTTSRSWALAGFDTVPDGTVTINGETFTLSNYSTVDAFMTAVNNDANANAHIYYNQDTDRFVIEHDAPGETLTISESANGFFTQAHITTGSYTTNTTGVQTDVLLKNANFDYAFSAAETGSFKINGVEIAWNADSDTLGEIISRINASEANVTAFYDESLDKVSFTANDTGSEVIQWEDVTGTFLGDALKLTGVTQNVGNDAKFTINSTDSGDEITKTSNTFTLNGLSVTLKDITVANDSYSDSGTTSVTVTSTQDTSAIRTKISSFLTKFNTVKDYLKNKLSVDPTTYSRGALSGETTFRTLLTNMTTTILDQVSGVAADDPSTLYEIGITFDENLHASITDESTMNDMINSDPSAVAAIFNSTYGIATRLYDMLDLYTETDGIIDGRKDIIQDRIQDIDDRVDKYQVRLSIKERQYRNELYAVQNLLNRAVQQQNLMTSILDSVNTLLGLT